jgi:hypothetical protein
MRVHRVVCGRQKLLVSRLRLHSKQGFIRDNLIR